MANYHRAPEAKDLDGRGGDDNERGGDDNKGSGGTGAAGPEDGKELSSSNLPEPKREPPETDEVLPKEETEKLVRAIEAAREHPSGRLQAHDLKEEELNKLDGVVKRTRTVKFGNKEPAKKSKKSSSINWI